MSGDLRLLTKIKHKLSFSLFVDSNIHNKSEKVLWTIAKYYIIISHIDFTNFLKMNSYASVRTSFLMHIKID